MSNRIDSLNRESFIENMLMLVSQLSENKIGCCLAIEGRWGIGKTFVIEKFEEQLKLIQSEKTNDNKYFVFHYNCWQYDYYEEPAVAIISAMIAAIENESNDFGGMTRAACSMLKEKLNEIAGVFVENKIGVNLISVAEDIKKEKDKKEKSVFEFNKLFNFSQTIEKTRKKLLEIAEERTIVFIVDELDRCIPEYAIKTLERLHHIFYGLENVVVIMAIDRKQLEHSVEEMFGMKNGSGFMDIDKYLKKFIDISMILDNGKINENLKEKYDFYFNKFEIGHCFEIDDILIIVSKLFEDIDIRTQEKIFEKADLIHSIICSDKVDISVLAFELMYEMTKMWKFDQNAYILMIKGTISSTNDKMVKVIDFIRKNAYSESGLQLKDNIYGKVFSYFFRIFNEKEATRLNTVFGITKELKAAKKYCEVCKTIK